MDHSFLTGLRGQFAQITAGLCRVVGLCLGGGIRPAVLPVDLAMAAYRRIRRVETLLLALMGRVLAGRHLVGSTRATSDAVEKGLVRTGVRADVVLPRRFGWLVGLVGHEAAGRASQLAHLLADPEMAALVRDVPQARRILSPLCWMLGVSLGGVPVVRRKRVRVVVTPAVVPVFVERVGYMPSARWPRGVIGRAPVRLNRV
eukprot:gene12937-13037_t